ncbi:MAG TPA: hypothetical protein EYP29_04815 [Thermoplasmata archaeon]|nr:hypothetical protein [Thermoplasmata archaeon]
MFKRILLTTEGTRSMERIINYVSELFPEASFHVISVVNTSIGSLHSTKLLIDLFDKQAEHALQDAKRILDQKGIEATYIKKRGNPAKEILKYINLNRMDLVTLGSSAQRGIAKLTFGHVGEPVIKKALCPVLVLNKNGRFERPNTILNPTDGKTHSVEAGILATSLANYFGATLHKCYVGRDKEFGEKVLRESSELARQMGVKEVDVCELFEGDPAEWILKRTDMHDMIVIGKGRKSLFKKNLLGFTSREVAALSPIPVFLVGH